MRNLNEFLNVVKAKCTKCGVVGHVPKEFAKIWICRICKKGDVSEKRKNKSFVCQDS